MFKKYNEVIKILVLSILILTTTAFVKTQDWGFYAHKKINRLAVYTLPPEMMYFFKANIEFITDHSPDPDKRKFVDPQEAIKHYIDIDYWGKYPFPHLPRTWLGVMNKYTEIYAVYDNSKALLFGPSVNKKRNDTIFGNNTNCIDSIYKNFIYTKVAYKILKEDVVFPVDSLSKWLKIDLSLFKNYKIIVEEHFSKEGISPYHLYNYYHSLVNAFSERNAKKILRRANDIGHYIGDASVPLHTTKNYNGQLTGQKGVHAFWENRIPELLGDTEFDYFVGKAEYVENIRDYFWNIILKSHANKDKVLAADMAVRKSFPDNKKFVFEERNGIVTRMQSEEYTRAFNKELNGMVEMRMRDAIKALGSIWYTAWIDAGQPNLKEISEIKWTDEELEETRKLNNATKTNEFHGRNHWD